MRSGLIFLISLVVSLYGNAKTFYSSPSRATLIELYSSEGCSSCPPAEKQLSELLENKDLWKKYVPVNFHVDYWNRLGWVDPYSSKRFSQRQRKYARSWGAKTVYTPAFVNNAQKVGPSLKLNQIGRSIDLKSIPRVKVRFDKEQIEIRTQNSKQTYDLHFAILGNGLISQVTTGENTGRRLIQNFTVLQYDTHKMTGGKIVLPRKKLESQAKPQSLSFALWLTEPGKNTPLQSLGGHL